MSPKQYRGHQNVERLDGSQEHHWLRYVCGHCDTNVSGAVVSRYQNGEGIISWLLCPNCAEGSVRTSNGSTYPGAAFGPSILGLPDPVAKSYAEARACIQANALTACELICRKILMHVAVDKGAAEGESFAAYLTYLETQGFVTPPMTKWVALIREHGNLATHRIEIPDRQRAEGTIIFTAELLRLVYEMEFLSGKYVPSPPSPSPGAS